MEAITRKTAIAAAALGLSTVAVAGMHLPKPALAEEEPSGATPAIAPEGRPDCQYGFLMNPQRCIDCGCCVEACQGANKAPVGQTPRRKIVDYESAGGRLCHVSYSCMHCEKPACAEVCPAGAISKTVGGIVVVDEERCIGCKYCYQACPFEAPHYNSASMYKCDYCFSAGVALGDAPNCVTACTTQALRFGPLEELLALSDRVRRIEGPTLPSAALV